VQDQPTIGTETGQKGGHVMVGTGRETLVHKQVQRFVGTQLQVAPDKSNHPAYCSVEKIDNSFESSERKSELR